MGFLSPLKRLGRKRRVPEELPDLAIDELKELSEEDDSREDNSEEDDSREDNSEEEDKNIEKALKEKEHHHKKHKKKKKLRKEREEQEEYHEKEEEKEDDHEPRRIEKSDLDDNSFFKKLLEDIDGEMDSLHSLEDWYHNKFLPKDVIGEMRNYWEHQKKDVIIKKLGKNFKGRIMEKIETLQELEKEWQDIYFDLTEKEEEIRDEEKELKKLLAEFVEICKRRGNIKNDESHE